MTAPLLHDNFVLTAHRGAVDRAPENTLLAFLHAQELGFAEAELDLQLSRDGHLVLAHDRTFRRLARVQSPLIDAGVEHLDLEQLRAIPLGLDQHVPTFTEVLDATRLDLQVEIKSPRAAVALGALLRSRSAGDRDRCMVTSFDPFALREFEETGIQLERGTGLLVADVRSDWTYVAEQLRAKNLLLHWPGLTRSVVDAWRERGYRVLASMFNDAGDLARILHTGVEGSSTDRPIFARALLAELRTER